nr:glycosyltransferase [Prevotella sp. P3-122]
MKISIITTCYNRVSTIRGAIESVLAQDYADIEYIIVDGGIDRRVCGSHPGSNSRKGGPGEVYL